MICCRRRFCMHWIRWVTRRKTSCLLPPPPFRQQDGSRRGARDATVCQWSDARHEGCCMGARPCWSVCNTCTTCTVCWHGVSLVKPPPTSLAKRPSFPSLVESCWRHSPVEGTVLDWVGPPPEQMWQYWDCAAGSWLWFFDQVRGSKTPIGCKCWWRLLLSLLPLLPLLSPHIQPVLSSLLSHRGTQSRRGAS